MVEADLVLYQAEHRPTVDTGASGGAIGTTPITMATIGEWIPAFGSNPGGGATREHYQKAFLKNEHATHSFLNARAYVSNLIFANLASSGVVKVQIPNSTDATDTVVTIFGYDGSGNFQTDAIYLAGSTSIVSGSKTFNTGTYPIIAAMVTAYTGGALKTLANAQATIMDSSNNAIGYIPAGLNSAIGFLDIGLADAINDTVQSTNRLTAPSGVSFSKPYSSATAISFANSGTLVAGSAQGIWAKCTVSPAIYNLIDWRLGLEFIGESSA